MPQIFNHGISNGVKPRVLIFSVAYEPLVGGAELAVRHITDRLLSYDFDLITCRLDLASPAAERIGNAQVYRVGFGSRLGRYLYPALAFRKARALQKQHPYQIVWAIMAAYGAAAALIFLRRFPKTKFLLTLQEGDPIEHIHGRVRGFRKLWRQVFRKADRIQAISNFLAQWARREGATCPIEVVPNGVDLEKFQITNHKSQTPKIITTSRLVHKNGIDILIRAFAFVIARRQPKQSQLQILGAGPDEAKLKKLARELGVANQVQFLGNVDPEKVPAYLQGADIFVRASRSEGLGSSFLEAMAAGLPVIGTPVGGIPDFLTDGETGLFARVGDPGDLAGKIKLLLQNPDLREDLGQNGEKLVRERYSWDHIAAQMNIIFQKLA